MIRWLTILLISGITSYAYAQQEIAASEIECLAMNIYHEARSESLAGQYAVADVVLNRVESSLYPDSICEVVFQSVMWEGFPVRDKCQFSWYCDGKSDHPTETDSWLRSITVAVNIRHKSQFRGITESATHYHTDYVSPNWNRSMHYVGRIGNHLFYLETR